MPSESVDLRALSKRCKERDGNRCVACKWNPGKRTGQFLHCHHIRPRSKWPALEGELWNTISLCYRCHWLISDGKARSLLEANPPNSHVLARMGRNQTEFRLNAVCESALFRQEAESRGIEIPEGSAGWRTFARNAMVSHRLIMPLAE